MQPPTLDVSELRVDYGPKRALDNISVQLAPGEILGLLGPNGSGKTTLVRSITAKLSPTSGRILVQGKQLRPGKAHKHEMAFTPQSLGLYKHLTAQENLEVFARFSGVPARHVRQRAAEALADIGLSDKAGTLTCHLSGGMQRRLHMAVSLLTNPALLVLDEPTAGVDLKARAAIHDLIRKRAAQGAAVVLVTHELEEAEKLCHKLGILHNGRLIQMDEPARIVKQVFGGARIFRLSLERPPTPQLQTQLHHIGLRPIKDVCEWHMWAELSLEEFLARLNQQYSDGSVACTEVAMRRPNINDVMQKISGTALSNVASEEHECD